MSDLISRSALIDCIRMIDTSHPFDDKEDILEKVLGTIDYQPQVDAVEVIRCKDCEHFESIMYRKKPTKQGSCELDESCDAYNETDFCSYGERK